MARKKTTGSSAGSRLVYSTEQSQPDLRSDSGGRSQGKRGKGRGKGAGGAQTGVPNDGIVRVWHQTKGRKGKGVTAITGLGLPADELSKLAGELKKACGSGGTAKEGVIEIQGDHREKLIEDLRGRGFRVKKAGG